MSNVFSDYMQHSDKLIFYAYNVSAPDDIATIMAAIQEWEDKTCITFTRMNNITEGTNFQEWLLITDGTSG